MSSSQSSGARHPHADARHRAGALLCAHVQEARAAHLHTLKDVEGEDRVRGRVEARQQRDQCAVGAAGRGILPGAAERREHARPEIGPVAATARAARRFPSKSGRFSVHIYARTPMAQLPVVIIQ
jgi:hypothetical protein